MKKMWLRLLSAALCLLMAMPCVLAEEAEIFPQRLEEGEYRTLSDMAAVGNTVYFLVYRGDESELWRWQEGGTAELAAEGLRRAANFSSLANAEAVWGAEDARHAIVSIFSDGERLMALNPLNGLVFQIGFSDAEAVFTDVVTLQDTEIFFRGPEGNRWCATPTAAAVSGGYLYWFGTGWDEAAGENRQRINCYNLTDGSVREVQVDKPTALCAWHDGRAAIVNAVYEEEGADPRFVFSLYDPAADSMTEAGVIDSPRSLTRIACCAELDALIWQDGTNIMGMQPGGEPQRHAYVPSTLNGRLAVTGQTLVFATTRATLTRTLVPGLTAPQSLQCMNIAFDAAAEAFAAQYPNVPIEVIRDDDNEGYAALMDPRNGGERLDVLRLYTTGEFDFTALRDAGMLLDMSGDEEIRAYVEALYPPFRELVTGENGEIWAVPTETVSYTGFFINRKAMTDMGFTAEDMPTNMVELCQFITMWDAKYADAFPNYCCIEYAVNTKRYLTDMAINMWIGHCQATGQALHFDDPEFRRVLEAIADVSTVRTDLGMQVTNPEISDYKSGLFWIDCQLVGNWAAYMEDYSDRIFIPFTLTENTPFHAGVDGVELWVVNRMSESTEYAMKYVREQIAQVNEKYAHVLLTTRTEPVENPYYAETLAYAQRQLGQLQMQLLDALTPEHEAEIRRQITAQEAYIATELKRGMYSVTPSAIENYVNVLAPAMYIHRQNVLQDTSEGVNAMEYIRDRWLNGVITTEQFVREADTRILMLEMAN